jgi:hypothetical protein
VHVNHATQRLFAMVQVINAQMTIVYAPKQCQGTYMINIFPFYSSLKLFHRQKAIEF